MLWEWLLQPIDSTRMHDVGFQVAWHGRFMTFAWAILVPLGVVVARYYKITAKQDWPNVVDNRFWWRCHLIFQISASVLTIVALILMWQLRDFKWTGSYHFLLGWLIAALAAAQLIGGFLRGSRGGPEDLASKGSLRGDHYDMTRRRLVFEVFHKTVGYCVLIVAQIAVLTGMWNANAPHWMWIVLSVWWCLLTIAVLWLKDHSRRPGTYQALWGPDPIHPGNQRRQNPR